MNQATITEAERLDVAKTLVVAEEATQKTLEDLLADEFIPFNRRTFRDHLRHKHAERRHAAGEAGCLLKLARRRAKNRVAKASRKANRS